jgi:competence protein CoiA
MLTALRCHDTEKVLARECDRSSGPFMCPACGTEALLIKGRLRIHHFRHRPEAIRCRRASGESAEHLACKDAIHTALRSCANVGDLELERPIGRNIADVYALIGGVPVAVEIQRSAIAIHELVARTLEYHRQGVFVLWVGLPCEELAFSDYSPRAWERWCHAMYGGRVYYWIEGQTVLPVHFDRCRVKTPAYEQRDVQGRVTVLGGGSRWSKTLRSPNHGPRVRIADQFRPAVRREWTGGAFDLPRCSLYLDTHRAWWNE